MRKPTPLLSLSEKLWAKAEFCNPTGSVKDRPARQILASVPPGSTVIEATSGNFGIALAALCKERGLKCLLVMPDSMTPERQTALKALGASVVLTPGREGMAASLEKARLLASAIPGSFLPKQFENPNNALAHYQTTGPEIWEQTGGKLQVFVAGAGTGGTLAGVARYLREQNPQIRIVAVEPAASPLLSEGRAGSHRIDGIGANFFPPLLQDTPIDQIVTVSDRDAFLEAQALNARGIPTGISAGANVWAAARFAAEDLYTVTLLPDRKDRYASLGL